MKRIRLLITIITIGILLAFSQNCFAKEAVEFVSPNWVCPRLPETTKEADQTIHSIGWAFAELVKRESPKIWWNCGEKTPLDQWHKRGEDITKKTLDAMYKNHLCVDPIGVIAIAFNESRGNTCSIGPRTRKAASKLGLLPVGKRWTTYNRAEILAILDNPKWIKRGYVADVGIYQDIFPRYSRILDKNGPLVCLGKRAESCRIPKIQELVQVSTSAEIGIHGMLYRHYFFRTREPWIYWPWTIKQAYSTAVKSTIKNLKTLIQQYNSKSEQIS